MALDLPHRHAAGIQAQDLVIEAIEPGLPLGDQLRLEAAGAIARHGNLDLAILRQDRLRARPVAAVAGAPAGGIALLVAQMLGQLGPKRSLDQPLLQLFEQPILAGQVFGLLIFSKQLIKKFGCYRRCRCYEADGGPPQSFCTLLGPSSR